MSYSDEKINYTNYLRDKPLETDLAKINEMEEKLFHALRERDVNGTIYPTYYADGCVLVRVNGEFYGVFNANAGKFFFGSVGD